MSQQSRYPAADRRRGLLAPTLIAVAILGIVAATVSATQILWRDLRSSLDRMDRSIVDTRERQRQLALHLAQAQALMNAQQARLQEAEETLKARESSLALEQSALAAERARLERTERSRKEVTRLMRTRELAGKLDLAVAGIGDGNGIQWAERALHSIEEWQHDPDISADRALAADLAPAVSEARQALDAVRAQGPSRTAQALQGLGGQVAGLRPVGTWQPQGPDASAVSIQLAGQLQTAALALSRGDRTLYRLALDAASAWVAAFYDPTNPKTAAFVAELKRLRDLPVRPDLGELHKALGRLRAVLGESIERAVAPTAGAGPSDTRVDESASDRPKPQAP